MKNQRIMSVYLNTRGFGFAVLGEKGEIIDCGVSVIRPINKEMCLKRVKEVISYYLPQKLILEKFENSKKSDRVRRLNKEISKYGEPHFKIYKYSNKQIVDTFEIFGAKNKFERSRKVVETYPELKDKLPEKRKPWKSDGYYQILFDTMTLILTHYYLEK